jgi:hypothetical protein
MFSIIGGQASLKKMKSQIRRFLSTSSSTYVPTDPKSLNWSTLGFSYVPTKSMVLAEYESGKWSTPKSFNEPYLKIHALSNVSFALC